MVLFWIRIRLKQQFEIKTSGSRLNIYWLLLVDARIILIFPERYNMALLVTIYFRWKNRPEKLLSLVLDVRNL